MTNDGDPRLVIFNEVVDEFERRRRDTEQAELNIAKPAPSPRTVPPVKRTSRTRAAKGLGKGIAGLIPTEGDGNELPGKSHPQEA